MKEVVSGIGHELLRDVDEELALVEEVVGDQNTRRASAAHGLRGGADENNAVGGAIREGRKCMLEQIVSNNNAAVTPTLDNNVLLGFRHWRNYHLVSVSMACRGGSE